MAKNWWKEGVVYQIYPRSFMDTNGDGIGDLKGIIDKLDYLKELGVDIIWLNPVYKSPNDDNGYDISDYRDIMDEFGTMADWDELLAGLHERGIKLIMDLVVNHSSDEHSWFIESKKSKDNPYRDYYIWREGKDGKEPNDWFAMFGGSAWEYDKETGEYFLHLFSKKQPDLNWRNPKVRNEVYEMMKWWLDKGIDGFRMDVINMIYKESEMADGKEKREDGMSWGGDYFMNRPGVHQYLQEMGREVLSKYDIMTVGECPGTTPEDGPLYTGAERNELSMIFQFEHMGVDADGTKWNFKKWSLLDLKEITGKWQTGLHGKGWNSIYLMNHDQPRAVSRFGNDGKYRKESAKMLAMFTLSLQGTPYIYQGEEIGMTNIKFDDINDYRDIESLNYYKDSIALGKKHDEIMNSIHYISRDNSRTPIQWDDTENAGFTTGTPWLGINPNYTYINVKESMADDDSVFYFYKKMIAYRKSNLSMIYGEYIPLDAENEKVYSYLRKGDAGEFLVMLNFTGEMVPVPALNETADRQMELEIGNYIDKGDNKTLRSYEARIYKVL